MVNRNINTQIQNSKTIKCTNK